VIKTKPIRYFGKSQGKQKKKKKNDKKKKIVVRHGIQIRSFLGQSNCFFRQEFIQ
jgi:hypothetical protein